MKRKVSPEEYKSMLNAIKAAQYIINYHLDREDFERAELMAKELRKLSGQLSSVVIEERPY